MKDQRNIKLLLGGLIALATAGCQSSKESDWSGTGPAGSISDINRKLGGTNPASTAPGAPTAEAQVVMLVVHDAEGKPLYAEVQRSSGDPATDRRAVDHVLGSQRFPKGAANTVSVTVDPKRLPKPKTPR